VALAGCPEGADQPRDFGEEVILAESSCGKGICRLGGGRLARRLRHRIDPFRLRFVEGSGREQSPRTFASQLSLAQGNSMGRIERLLAGMTVVEKIGQLNMAASFRAVTGPGARRDLEEGIRSGRLGNVLNVWGRAPVRALQQLAVEHSRLGIPLL